MTRLVLLLAIAAVAAAQYAAGPALIPVAGLAVGPLLASLVLAPRGYRRAGRLGPRGFPPASQRQLAPAVGVWIAAQTADFLSQACMRRLYALFPLVALRGLRAARPPGCSEATWTSTPGP